MDTTCPSCGGPVVEITVNGLDAVLTMRACAPCESRSWTDADGDPVPMASVLAEMAVVGGRRRARSRRD